MKVKLLPSTPPPLFLGSISKQKMASGHREVEFGFFQLNNEVFLLAQKPEEGGTRENVALDHSVHNLFHGLFAHRKGSYFDSLKS